MKAFARFWMPHHSTTIPRDAADIDLVAQNTITTTCPTVNRTLDPSPAPRCLHAIRVQVVSYVPRAGTVSVLSEDPADDIGLGFYNRAFSGLPRHRLIAVGQTTGTTPFANTPGKAALDFVNIVFAVKLANKAAQPD